MALEVDAVEVWDRCIPSIKLRTILSLVHSWYNWLFFWRPFYLCNKKLKRWDNLWIYVIKVWYVLREICWFYKNIDSEHCFVLNLIAIMTYNASQTLLFLYLFSWHTKELLHVSCLSLSKLTSSSFFHPHLLENCELFVLCFLFSCSFCFVDQAINIFECWMIVELVNQLSLMHPGLRSLVSMLHRFQHCFLSLAL